MTADLLSVLDRFLEATSVTEKERKIRPIQQRLERAMQRAFRAQGKAFMAGFGRLRPQFQESARLKERLTEDLWWEVFNEAANRTLPQFVEPLGRAIGATLRIAAADMVAQVGVQYSFSLDNPRAVLYIQEHGAELVRGINAGTQRQLRRIITQAVEEGWNYDDTAAAITERYREFAVGKPQQHIESRAHLVAVTETGNAYEAGNDIVARDLQDAGLNMEKKWQTVGDSRVSEECAENEAEGWIPYGQAHKSGHMHPLRFPGCRCTELHRMA